MGAPTHELIQHRKRQTGQRAQAKSSPKTKHQTRSKRWPQSLKPIYKPTIRGEEDHQKQQEPSRVVRIGSRRIHKLRYTTNNTQSHTPTVSASIRSCPTISSPGPPAPGIERTPGSCYRPPGIDDGSADIAVGNLTAFRPLGAFVSNPPTGTAAVEKRALDRRGSGPPSLKHWRSSDKTSIADHSRIVSLSGAAPPARSPAVWVGRSSSTVQRWKQELPVAPMLIAARQRRNNTRSQL